MGIRKILKSTFLFIFLASSIVLSAQEVANRFHTVKEGETVYGIARQYGMNAEALLQFNPEIDSEGLQIGAKVLIPGSKALELIHAKNVEEQKDTAQYHYHKVEAGQTLYSLAKQYGVKMSDIEEANPIVVSEGLKVGMLIRIPKKTEERTAVPTKDSGETIPTIAKGSGDTTELTNSDDQWFYHRVASKQTAYSLAKRYTISLDSLYLLNPTAETGLRIGQWLKFPLNRKPKAVAKEKEAQPFEGEVLQAELPSTKTDTPKVSGAAGKSNYFLYKVKAGDTFFNLKKRYFVTEEELIKLNPELKQGLEQGRYIIMPKKEESKELSWLEKILKDKQEEEKPQEVSDQTEAEKKALNTKDTGDEGSLILPVDSLEIDSTKEYRIAVVLPFRASIYPDTINYRNFNPHRDSEMSMQFYLGLKTAADSLKAQGMNLRLRVYDTEGSPNRIKAIAQDMRENKIDLVFGPAYKRNVELLSDELKEIPIISPLSMAVEVDNKPNLVQMIPSDAVRQKRIADLVNNHYPQAKVYFAHCGSADEKAEAQAIKAYLNPRSQEYVSKIVDCDELQNSRSFSLGPKDTLPKVVVLLSNKPVFTTDLISKLYSLRDTNIVLVGSPRVLAMPTMELHYLNALNFATYEVRNVEYEDSLTQDLINDFRATYEADAGPFAIQGFDASYFFLKQLWTKGPYLLDSLEPALMRGTGFDFVRKEGGGLENQFLFLSQIKDFELKRLD